ncbi:hypothetical protein C6500_09705 [Candidatus Poribacteria bacterium]|nr:MAG: hypothetical protein C6500_09705 [Candidatus Poribacteria bacterium]
MKKATFCLLLATLLASICSGPFAQQHQSTQKSNPEIETLEKQILILQNQLQTVENEKLEVVAKLLDAQAKLADSNAKLANVEFGKFERGLRDSNNKWLWSWTAFFGGIFAVIGIALWFFLKSLIADRVEKSLPGFKDAMDQVDILENQLRVLEKEHAASVLENFINVYYDQSYPQSIEALHNEVLLQVFGDEKYRLPIKEKAIEVLATRKSPQLVSPVLEFLNLIVDSNFDWQTSIDGERLPFRFLSFVGQIHIDAAHRGLKKFLNRLLTENPKHKHLFLAWTAFYLAEVDVELELKDSISLIKRVILNLEDPQQVPQVLSRLAEYFNTFNEPEGIKEILTNGLTDQMPDVETECLELLQKHDPDFVKEWQAQKESANAETEEPS